MVPHTPAATESERQVVLSTLLDAMRRMDDRSAEMAGLRADLEGALGLQAPRAAPRALAFA